MSLIPKLLICAKNGCSTLNIKEVTGVYHSVNNPFGWGTPNPSTADILSAQIIITSPTGIVTTVDVLSQLEVPYTDPFYFNDISITPEDGEWTIQYTLDDSITTYSNQFKIFLTCSIRCCLDSQWVEVIDNMSCLTCSNTINEVTEKAMFMESLYSAMVNAAICNNVDARDKIFRQLQRLCKINKCNC